MASWAVFETPMMAMMETEGAEEMLAHMAEMARWMKPNATIVGNFNLEAPELESLGKVGLGTTWDPGTEYVVQRVARNPPPGTRACTHASPSALARFRAFSASPHHLENPLSLAQHSPARPHVFDSLRILDPQGSSEISQGSLLKDP